MEKEVTVLIPSYNPGLFLKEAIESVFRQTHKKWNIILVDDASTDDSIEIIKNYLKDPRVKLIQNSKNLGQSKSMNKGLKYIHTEFFMLLDSDDWLEDQALEVFLKQGEKVSNDTALILCNVIQVYYEDGMMKRQLIRRPEWGKVYKNRYEILRANLFPWQKFYRTSAVKNIGGWPINDPHDGRYVEDLRIFLKLIEKYRFHWHDQALYNYRLHKTNKTNNREIIAEMVEWIIRDALKRWGDKYEPVFKTIPGGWKLLDKLNPKTN